MLLFILFLKLPLSSQGFLLSAAVVVIHRNVNTHRYISKPGKFNLKYILALECPQGWNWIAQEMNNGIHYYDQLKSNLTQGIPMLFSSSETVMSNAVLLQLIFYPTTEALQQRGIFFLPKKKKKEVHLCSLKEEKETKTVLLHIQIIFVLAHFSSMTHKKCLSIMHSVKLDRINILWV